MGYEENVRRVTPYVPGEQPSGKVIKLNTNESPYPPSPKVVEVLKETPWEDLKKYPEQGGYSLLSAIAAYYGVRPENVFAGAGSDDVLALSFLTFFNGGKKILFPDITYSFYDVWASVYGIPYETVPLREDFTIDPDDYKGKDNGGIVIANPNAPTSVSAGLDVIEDIISSNPDVMVIVDEAYVDFGGTSALPLLKKYDNLLVVQTMSKSRCLAGMRVGFAIGSEKAIKYLDDVKNSVNSYTMNTASILAGKAAIEDDAYFRETRDRIVATRERVKKEFKDLRFDFPDSRTNFIFASHEGTRENETRAEFAKRAFETLKSKGIYVRYFNKPRINEYLRITVGSDEEMDILISELKEIINP